MSRFDALSEDTKEEKPRPQSVTTHTTVTGTEKIQFPLLDEATQPRMSKSSTGATFYGRCYQCGYVSHSQKHCPLRVCDKCFKWGHSDLVCPKKAVARAWDMPSADRTPQDPWPRRQMLPYSDVLKNWRTQT